MFKTLQTLKVAAAATALFAAQSVLAASTFQSGSSDITFTPTAVQLSGLVNLVVTATPGSTTSYNGTTATATQAITGATFAASGDVTDYVSAGSGLTFSIGTDTVKFSNFDVDLAAGKVYSDVAVSLNSTNYTHQALFDIASSTQTTSASSGLTYTKAITASGLTLDSAASSTWLSTLLAASGLNLNLSAVQFATLSANVTATAAVPEPSTYAMLAVGLIAVGAVARRRSAAAK